MVRKPRVVHGVRKVGDRWFNETFAPAGRGGRDLLHPSPEVGGWASSPPALSLIPKLPQFGAKDSAPCCIAVLSFG